LRTATPTAKPLGHELINVDPVVDGAAAAVECRLAPLIIARGGAVRVFEIEDEIVTIEASGSPGVFVPVWSRLEAVVRPAIPEVTGLRLGGPRWHSAAESPT
jgi:hypothetical protein